MLSRTEQEVLISRGADEDRWNVFTTYRPWVRRLDRLAREHPDEVRCLKRDDHGGEWEVPIEWVRIRPKRSVSEEHMRRFAKNARRGPGFENTSSNSGKSPRRRARTGPGPADTKRRAEPPTDSSGGERQGGA